MSVITRVSLRRIRDSLGRPTVEATVFSGRVKAAASTPSGTSAGRFEACLAPRPVPQLIVQARNLLVPRLLGEELDLKKADGVMREADGTPVFSKIGAAVSTAVSAAVAKCAAKKQGVELYEYLNPRPRARYGLPRLLCKIIGGGLHAPGGPAFQEFLAAPKTRSFAESLKACRSLRAETRKALGKLHGFRGRTDLEGGWTGAFTNEQALSALSRPLEKLEERSVRADVGVDVAAGALYARGAYRENGRLSEQRRFENLLGLCEQYGLFYVEDPFREQAFRAFARFSREFNGIVCADDLVATNPQRLKHAIRLKACSAVIIKPNQAGTLSQACETVRLAEKRGVVPVPSHRSGETCDETIAHLAVAFSCPFIKLTLAGRERTAKIRELLRIGEKLNA